MKYMVLSLFAITAFSQTYKIDTAHSTVGFQATHLMVTKVNGNFKKFSGTIDFDKNQIEKSKVQVEIDPSSIHTGIDKRDEHLRGEDFFDVKKFPKITYTSTKVIKKSEKSFQVEGELNVHGVTKPMTLDVDFNGELNDPKLGKHVGFSATGKMNRKDFGIKFSQLMDNGGAVVGDEVKILLEIEGE